MMTISTPIQRYVRQGDYGAPTPAPSYGEPTPAPSYGAKAELPATPPPPPPPPPQPKCGKEVLEYSGTSFACV